ncbi:nucleolar complex protein 3 homolog [Panonychus citri]|uniref:nucleolar complex protein 3 homolog n=1 Tax=Panonychus citri TaxID=50023 RepID=UPI002307BDAE|nr:nucleolar complex protein 3 homolog [Panonychus citri]
MEDYIPLKDDFLASLGKREKTIETLKDRIAGTCSTILARPEKNLTKLRKLILLLDVKEESEAFRLTFITGQKLIAFSVLEVFKDLIPGYRVAEKMKEEGNPKKRFKKVTLTLRGYETRLLSIYKLYLARLRRMVQLLRRVKSQKSDFFRDILFSDEARERVAAVGVKCLTELLVAHPHFNCRASIIQLIVPVMTLSKHPEIADKVCSAVGTIFRQDKLGEVSLEIVKEMEKLIKACGLFIRPQVIYTLTELKIKEVEKKGREKAEMKEVRKDLEKMSRKAKRRQKASRKLDNVLLETDAQESYKRRLENHTKILNHLFITYFRILKRTILDLSDDQLKKEKFKELLTPVLEGLSKFCHLINVEFFDDLVNVLFKMVKSDLLDAVQTLNCCQTVFTILSEEASALNIDHQRFYTRLYQILPDIDLSIPEKTIIVLLKCLETMIIKRRRISFPRVVAFTKRCATVCLQSDDPSILALLSFIRRMFIEHPRIDVLIDSETMGTGLFMPHVEDPEYCNAHATQLWELNLLGNHCNPTIRTFSRNIANGCSSDEVRSELVKKRPIEVYEDYEDKGLTFLDNESNEIVKNLSKKSRFHGLILESTSLTSKAVRMVNNDC